MRAMIIAEGTPQDYGYVFYFTVIP
jgi:hypothetical protein